jgi:hypothetical protein
MDTEAGGVAGAQCDLRCPGIDNQLQSAPIDADFGAEVAIAAA